MSWPRSPSLDILVVVTTKGLSPEWISFLKSTAVKQNEDQNLGKGKEVVGS
jgi:hypothetical protein